MPDDLSFRVGENQQICLVQGDITKIRVDAIVNAANSELAGGGGVDGAIHAAGGPEIMAELDGIRKRIGRCEPGNAVMTGAGRLPAKYVFHAVGPRFRDGNHGEARVLQSCYEICLQLARELEVTVISFPSISTGVYGYPVKEASAVAIRTVVLSLREDPGAIKEVKLVQFSKPDSEMYRATAKSLLGQLSAAG